MRNEYRLSLVFNNRFISSLIIDQHYKLAHPEITDELILELVKQLNYATEFPETQNLEFEYFKKDPLLFLGKPYRLVFLTHKWESYLGVINAFRIKRKNR